MEIKVLGPGCPRCDQTMKVVQEAVASTGLEVKTCKITDMMEIAAAGVMSTPAVIVDGKLVSAGKVPSKVEVLRWLKG